MRSLNIITRTFAPFIIAALTALSANAAGTETTDVDKSSCGPEQVWSSVSRKCLKKTAEILTDEDYYKQSVELIEAKKYKQGIDLLWRMKEQKQPKVLNYLGYAHRKMGKVDKGIKYYKQALALNADFHPARQYLGEGYIQKGDVKKAKLQLAELEKRCGKECEHYVSLAKVIADAK